MKTLEKRERIAVAAGIVVVTILFFGGSIWNLLFGSGVVNTASAPINSLTSSTTTPMQNISTTSGVEIYDEQVGTGAEAVSGKTVSAHYVGTFTDGTKFDSSIDRGEPFTFTLGAGQVIKGWDVGIAGMKVGGVRKLVISPEYGYGARAIGPIPANSTLVFEVQLVDVK